MNPLKNTAVMAIVLLRDPLAPNANAVIEQIQAATGSRYEMVPSPAMAPDQSCFRLDEDELTLQLVRSPMPWTDSEHPCESNWRWEEAQQACNLSRAHHAVVLRTSDPDPIAARLRLTHVLAADLEATGGAGVYWGEGSVVNAAHIFTGIAREASRSLLPLYLWVNFQARRLADGHVVFATRGMNALGLMDLELVRQTNRLHDSIEELFNFAHYLCDHGPVLKDGDTIGTSASQRLRVRHVPSFFSKDTKVYRLDESA